MNKYGKEILNTLLDQYERSKSFIGSNTHKQSFSKKIEDLFPKYTDDAEYELFHSVNEQVEELERAGLVKAKRQKRGKQDSDIVQSVQLCTGCLAKAYEAVNREPKTDRNQKILQLLDEYKDRTPLLTSFYTEQIDRIWKNKKALYSDDLSKLEQILKVLSEIEKVEEETFIRNFSVRVLGDSKAFEKIKSQVVSILCEYGDYSDKDHVLQNLNIVNNPGYVYVKGSGIITIAGQRIDFRQLTGDLGLGSALLDQVEQVEVLGNKVITIENLTTFHTYEDDDALIIYLGGYHNSIRRRLIRKIYDENTTKQYYHYGDIDAGGFYILLDLRAKTGIPFTPLNMDIATLERYKQYTKALTDHDKTRLKNLCEGEFHSVVKYMLEHNCKLEQEAVE